MFISLLYEELTFIKIIPQIKLMSMIISIEHCKNCSYHNWCSRHDEKRYEQLALDLKNKILAESPNINVVINHVPASYRKFDPHGRSNKYYDRQQSEFVTFPRLGSFEVYFDKMLISSKILTASWPIVEHIMQTIKTIIERKNENKDISEFDLSSKLAHQQKQPPITKKQHMEKFRKTYLSQASYNRKDVNDLYVAQIRKIYQVPKKITQKPKFLKDGLTEIYKNKSDLFQQNEQQVQRKKPKMYQSSYGIKFRKQIKGIQYLQKTPYEIMREKKLKEVKKVSKHRFADHNKKHNSMHHTERNSPKKILFDQGIYLSHTNNQNSNQQIATKASLEKELFKMLQQDQINKTKKIDTKQLLNKRPQYKASYRTNQKHLNKKANTFQQATMKKQTKHQQLKNTDQQVKKQHIEDYLIKNKQSKQEKHMKNDKVKDENIIEEENSIDHQGHKIQQHEHEQSKQEQQNVKKEQKLKQQNVQNQQENKQQKVATQNNHIIEKKDEKQEIKEQGQYKQDQNIQKNEQAIQQNTKQNENKEHNDKQDQNEHKEESKQQISDKKESESPQQIQQEKQVSEANQNKEQQKVEQVQQQQIQNPQQPKDQHQQLKHSENQQQEINKVQEEIA